jgi:hypothetical protein
MTGDWNATQSRLVGFRPHRPSNREAVPSCSPGVDAKRPLLGHAGRTPRFDIWTTTWSRHAAHGCRALARLPWVSRATSTPSRSRTATRSLTRRGVAARTFGRRNLVEVHDRAGIGDGARFPGERSLSLGTPRLHDVSPLGLNAAPRPFSDAEKQAPIIVASPRNEPQRGSVMQPKGAEPWRGSLGSRMPHRPHQDPGPQSGPVRRRCVAAGTLG